MVLRPDIQNLFATKFIIASATSTGVLARAGGAAIVSFLITKV